jgi:RND family efflux transporter MFP subunit
MDMKPASMPRCCTLQLRSLAHGVTGLGRFRLVKCGFDRHRCRRVVHCAIVAAIFWWCTSGQAFSQAPLLVEPARKTINVSGFTRSGAKMNVASEVGGKVLAVYYDVGQTIADKPFAEIDATFIQFQIDQANWTLQKLDVARERAASHVSYLEKEFQRIDQLLHSDATTQTRHDAAAEELAQSRLEVKNTQLEINAIKTQLAELRERLKRHAVAAPKGWVVVERRIEPGEIIAAGTLLGRLADFRKMVVPLYVSAEELSAIKQQNPLMVQVEGRTVSARLNWINPEFDERTRKLAIELVIQDDIGPHRGGLHVELALEVDTKGLMVPKEAVENRFDNPRVVLQADGRSVPVIILGENNGQVLIADNPALPPGTVLKAMAGAP